LYNIFSKDYKAFNKIIDLFKNIGIIENIFLKKPSLAFSSVFLVWHNKKKQIIVNIKKVNTKINCNIYLLLKQNNILIIIDNAIVFSILDITKSFF